MNRRMKTDLGVRSFGRILVVTASLVLAGPLFAETRAEHLARVQREIAEQNLGWTAGETSVSTLTDEQFHSMLIPLGAEPSPFERFGEPVSKPLPPLPAWVPFPAPEDPEFTWQNVDGKDWTSPVKDQGQCGSCIVFAAVSAMEGALNLAFGNPDLDFDLSEQNLLDCTSVSCENGGFSPNGCFARGKQAGVPDEACQPYLAADATCNGAPCADFANRVRKVVASGHAAGTQWKTASVAQVKEALSHGPVTTSLTIYDDFMLYKSGVYKKTATAKEQGGHEVVIVGWNDANNSWYGKNSWSTFWGQQGYFEIERGQVDFGERDVMWVQMDATGVLGAFCLGTNSVFATLVKGSGVTAKRPVKLTHCAGDQPLSWKVEGDTFDWLSIDPAEGTLQPGDAVNITVLFDEKGWTGNAGSGAADLFVIGPGGLSRTLSVRLGISEKKPEDTDTGSGSDTSGDTGGDTDGDTDTNADGGSAADGGGSGCGCSTPGNAPAAGADLLALLASLVDL
ncbi:MAG: C1 family peptidase [Deltaproteobacteria bacterium]|nr:C1 family peptidase [Deltaproteobacteria bacterium]